MRRKEDHPLEKVTMLLYKGDFIKLQMLHSDMGASKVVRKLIRQHLNVVEERLISKTKETQLNFSFINKLGNNQEGCDNE